MEWIRVNVSCVIYSLRKIPDVIRRSKITLSGKRLVGAIDVLMRYLLKLKKCISITIAFIVSADLRFGRDSEGNCVVRADNNLVIGAACGVIITPPRYGIIFCTLHFHETGVTLHRAVINRRGNYRRTFRRA